MQVPDEFPVIRCCIDRFLEYDEHASLTRIFQRPSYDKLSLFERADGWLTQNYPGHAEVLRNAFPMIQNLIARGEGGGHKHGSVRDRLSEIAEFYASETLDEIGEKEWYYRDYCDLQETKRSMVSLDKLAKMFDCHERTIRRISDEGLINLYPIPNKQRGKFAWSDEIDHNAIRARIESHKGQLRD